MKQIIKEKGKTKVQREKPGKQKPRKGKHEKQKSQEPTAKCQGHRCGKQGFYWEELGKFLCEECLEKKWRRQLESALEREQREDGYPAPGSGSGNDDFD